MKTFKNILAALTVIVVFFSCKDNTKPEIKTIASEATVQESTLDQNATYAKAEFTIEGMTCAMGCAKSIEKKLAKMEGVKSAEVDFDRKLAMVEYDEAKVNAISLEETVKKTGEDYSVTDMKTVDEFKAKKACPPDCDKTCCEDKSEAEKKACSEDCKKACCASKA
ncbi:MAG: heavy-metal-associated domain-containing protein [Flavobacteriaceae bacterium]|nr:cation transporter [Bacteroidia bacterium]NNF73948.1 heavy-metal-associated domain-containing protein [Flavobacteriaceae bacterium]NNK71933.1 heavy-metal-associated domain-containing protein [Flavobacteriaceae bacterium]